jgi:hypothetical protein
MRSIPRKARHPNEALLALVTGGVAQLGERLLCKQEVIGSIPFTSTTSLRLVVSRQGKLVSPKARDGGRRSPWSLSFYTIVEVQPYRRLRPTVRSLTCEERSVTETGVSFAKVYPAQAGCSLGNVRPSHEVEVSSR